MIRIKIPAGDIESSVYALAHYKLCALSLPKVKEENELHLYGGFEIDKTGPITRLNDKSDQDYYKFKLLSSNQQFIVFDPSYFTGVIYYKLVLNKPLSEDLLIEAWHQDD